MALKTLPYGSRNTATVMWHKFVTTPVVIKVRVSDDSVVCARFYHKHEIEYSLFVLLIFLLHLVLKHRSKKVNKTKNAPFCIGSGNEPFRLEMLGDNLPLTIRHQPMLITIINMYIVLKKIMSRFM